MLSEISQIVKIVEKIDKSKRERLKAKTKVNHMNTRTTKNTMQLSESTEKQFSKIGETIIDLNNDGKSLKQIREQLSTQVGSIIANTVRESYLSGLHFIESFKERTITLTESMVREINKEIDRQIQLFWNSVKDNIKKDEKNKNTPLQGAAGPADLFLLNLFNQSFANSAISMSFFALNQGTISSQLQVFKEEIKGVGTLKGSVKVPQSIWVSERDGRVCPICKNLDGKTWFVNDKQMPRPVVDSHLKCRCRLLPLDNGRVFNA